MRLQTDQEFKQQTLYDPNKKFNVDMFTTSLSGGKPFAAEQKINKKNKRVKILLRSKRIEKYNKKNL